VDRKHQRSDLPNVYALCSGVLFCLLAGQPCGNAARAQDETIAAPPQGQTPESAAEHPIPAVSGTQLFADDCLIANRTGAVRRVHAGEKLPAPVMCAQRPWEQAEEDRRVYVYGTVLGEPGDIGLRMWYNRLTSVLYATSPDGIACPPFPTPDSG